MCCFVAVETKNIDGETNLKVRSAIARVHACCGSEASVQAASRLSGQWVVATLILTLTHTHALSSLITLTPGVVACDPPNKSIHQFSGKLSVSLDGDGQHGRAEFPLNIDNLLLRGSTLRNTHAVIGLCIYTGVRCGGG